MNFKFSLGSLNLENGESLHKPCYCERWLHRKPHFFSSDRRTAGVWQSYFRHERQCWLPCVPSMSQGLDKMTLLPKLPATCINLMSLLPGKLLAQLSAPFQQDPLRSLQSSLVVPIHSNLSFLCKA